MCKCPLFKRAESTFEYSERPMQENQSVTCEVRYKLDLTKLPEFEAYARA